MIVNLAPQSMVPLPASARDYEFRGLPSLKLIWVGQIGLLASLLLDPVLGEVRPGLLAVPLLTSIVFFGLPHGALDHRVAARLFASFSGTGGQLIFFCLYLLLMFVYLGVWWFLPILGFGSFLLLTLIHWGHGELWVVRGRGWRRANGFSAWLIILLRGGAPILIPVVVYPGVVAEVGSWAMGLFGPVNITEFRDGLEFLRMPLAGLYGSALAAYAALGWSECRSGCLAMRNYAQDGGELLLLILFFGLVSPLLAIGIYFTFWHSLRHIDRLRWALLEPENAKAAGHEAHTAEVPLRVSGVLVRSIPLTLASLVLLVGLGFAVQAGWFIDGGPAIRIENLVGVYLLLLAILTLPHTLLVFAMDHRADF